MSTAFPKDAAFSVKMASHDAAAKFATAKRKNGGCFEVVDGGYQVFWLPAGTSHNFAW